MVRHGRRRYEFQLGKCNLVVEFSGLEETVRLSIYSLSILSIFAADDLEIHRRYMGAPAYCVAPPCSGQLFAHGGSGIFWSRSAVERLIAARHEEGEDKYDARWEEVTEKTCCGDVVLAEAFQEVGVHLTKASPMVSVFLM